MTKTLPQVRFSVHSPDPRERSWTDVEARAAFEAGEAPSCSITGRDAWAHFQKFGPTPEQAFAQKIISLYGPARFVEGRFPNCTWKRDPNDDTLPPWIVKRRAAQEAAAKARVAA